MASVQGLHNYTIISTLGEGAFGVVLRARHNPSGRIVALKRVSLPHGKDAESLSEVMSLREAAHPNIVRLYEVFPDSGGLVLVLEALETDVSSLIYAGKRISLRVIKSWLRDFLRAVSHLHSLSLIHRDIKPSNLLLDADGRLKLSDFGLARRQPAPGRPMSHQVATRWYRSPELLYGACFYDNSMDMWAVGCVFAELLNQAPLFPGSNDIDQLGRVLQFLGGSWQGAESLPDYGKIEFAPMPAQPLSELVPNQSPATLDLLGRMLCVPPEARISAADALVSPFFTVGCVVCVDSSTQEEPVLPQNVGAIDLAIVATSVKL